MKEFIQYETLTNIFLSFYLFIFLSTCHRINQKRVQMFFNTEHPYFYHIDMTTFSKHRLRLSLHFQVHFKLKRPGSIFIIVFSIKSGFIYTPHNWFYTTIPQISIIIYSFAFRILDTFFFSVTMFTIILNSSHSRLIVSHTIAHVEDGLPPWRFLIIFWENFLSFSENHSMKYRLLLFPPFSRKRFFFFI